MTEALSPTEHSDEFARARLERERDLEEQAQRLEEQIYATMQNLEKTRAMLEQILGRPLKKKGTEELAPPVRRAA